MRAKMYNKKRHSEKIQMKKTYVFFLGSYGDGGTWNYRRTHHHYSVTGQKGAAPKAFTGLLDMCRG